MRLRSAAKMMALHNPLKTFTLAYAGDIYKSFRFENLHQYAISGFDPAIAVGFDRNFPNKLHRRNVVLRKVSEHRLRQPRLFHKFDQPELCTVVAVSRLRLMLRDHAWPRLQHRRRTHFA